jgi:hypothetical protein
METLLQQERKPFQGRDLEEVWLKFFRFGHALSRMGSSDSTSEAPKQKGSPLQSLFDLEVKIKGWF